MIPKDVILRIRTGLYRPPFSVSDNGLILFDAQGKIIRASATADATLNFLNAVISEGRKVIAAKRGSKI